MKFLTPLLLFFIFFSCLTSCTKDGQTGPIGPQGQPGAVGLQGIAGNNVLIDSIVIPQNAWISNNSQNFSYVASTPKLTQARIYSCAIVVSVEYNGYLYGIPDSSPDEDTHYHISAGQMGINVDYVSPREAPIGWVVHYAIISPTNISFAKDHGFNIGTYRDVVKGFHLK